MIELRTHPFTRTHTLAHIHTQAHAHTCIHAHTRTHTHINTTIKLLFYIMNDIQKNFFVLSIYQNFQYRIYIQGLNECKLSFSQHTYSRNKCKQTIIYTIAYALSSILYHIWQHRNRCAPARY